MAERNRAGRGGDTFAPQNEINTILSKQAKPTSGKMRGSCQRRSHKPENFLYGNSPAVKGEAIFGVALAMMHHHHTITRPLRSRILCKHEAQSAANNSYAQKTLPSMI